MERHEIEDVAPTSLGHLIGQRGVVEQVKVALDAAHQDGKKFDHALLTGGAGLGKTQTAKVIAAEMCCDFHEALGQSVSSPADFNALSYFTRAFKRQHGVYPSKYQAGARSS